jgi:hypothetical protein
MVTVVVLLFLIATVIFALSLMISQSGNSVIDGRRQNDSTAAFFAAESGLEAALASLSASAQAGTYTDASCTGLAGTTNNSWGTVTLSTVSAPATCDQNGATPCTSCSVTSTGQMRQATRTVTLNVPLTVKNGVTCNGATSDCSNTPVTWQLKLKNNAGVAGVGVFNLTYIRQGNNTPTCAAGSNCRLEMNLSSPSNGTNSTGLMGNAVLIPAGSTYPIYQTMSKPHDDLAEVGVFFYGTSPPTLTGQDANPGSAAFWDDNKNSSTNTVGASGATLGHTNDGTFDASGDSCNGPGSHSQSSSCQTWCYGGDTLVFLFAGNVTTLSDQLSGVTFGSGAQSMAMTRVTKYPTTLDTGAPTDVDAEIWYAGNANFVGASPIATQVSSYKGRSTTGSTSASIGAQWNSANGDGTQSAITGTTLTVGSGFTGYPNQIISVGDSVAENPSGSSGGTTQTCISPTSCGTIVAQLTSNESGGALGGRGTYQISASQTVSGNRTRTWTISSNVLRVHGCTICAFANGDALSGAVSGRTINGAQASASNSYGRTEATGGIGRYPISGTATYMAATNNVLYAGTPAGTLYINTASPQPPAAGLLPMMIKLTSGTGALVAGTKVTASSAANAATTAMTLSATPTTPLDLANVCGGTCALFVTAPGTTPFTLSGITGNFNEWASGFMCLKGVDVPPQIVTSSSATSSRWTEVVQ